MDEQDRTDLRLKPSCIGSVNNLDSNLVVWWGEWSLIPCLIKTGQMYAMFLTTFLWVSVQSKGFRQ